MIFRLRLEDFEAKQTAKILWGVNKNKKGALQSLKDASQAYLSPILTPLSAKFSALKSAHPILEDASSWLSKIFSLLIISLKSRVSGKAWFASELTLFSVKQEFISILNSTIHSGSSQDPSNLNPNTTISFAIFSVPDFFNKTLCDLIIEAAKEVGIDSIPLTIARTVAAGMGAQTRELLAEDITGSTRGMIAQSRFKHQNRNGNMKWDAKGLKSLDANAKPNHPEPTTPAINLPSNRPERILIADQSRFYAALRTYEVEDRSVSARRVVAMARANERRNRKGRGDGGDEGGVFQQKYLPLDPYGSQIIDTKLYQRVLGRELALKEEIGWGADEEKLRDEVARARLLIKDSLDREVGLLDRDEMGEGEGKKDVDRHHEEWPLNLNGWSASGRDLQVVLRWEDVVAVEDNYVDKFAEAVHMFLVTLRRRFCFLLHLLCYIPQFTKSNQNLGIRTFNDETTHPETIHTVVILTDHTDGDLLTRAIIQALGKDVRIVGGNLLSMTLAAEGAAKLGIRRLKSWEEVMRQERLMEFLVSGEGEW